MRVVIMRSNAVLPDPRVEKEANSLIEAGHQVQILAWNRVAQKQGRSTGYLFLEHGQLPIRWFNIKASFGNGLKNLLPLLLFQICLIWWLIKHRKDFDVIHACDFDTVIPAWFCAKFLKKKYVYDIFDYYVDAFNVPGFLKKIVEKIDIHMINAASAVIIVNESRIEQISKSSPKKLYVIHNSPDINIETAADQNSSVAVAASAKPKFAYIGVLGDGRLLKEIIETFQTHPEWELHIAGFGAYEQHVRSVSIQHNNIIFYGRIPYKTALEIERQCDVLFAIYDPNVPNHRYSSPNKLYEAMMLGKPIIVSKGTGIDQIVEKEKIGISIEYCKADFERAAYSIVDSNKITERISKESQQLYFRRFSWTTMSKRLLDMYQSL